jgi:hypothetical protein
VTPGRQPGTIDSTGVLIATSRDPDAKITFVECLPDRQGVAIKLPTTDVAGGAVCREGRLLVALRCLQLGPVGATIPRYVRSSTLDGRPVLVSAALPGSPMSVGYHAWRHTARHRSVARDFAAAAGWLRDFQQATAGPTQQVTWPAEVAEALAGRWDGHPALPPALDRLQVARAALAGHRMPLTAVHGDFWCGNILLRGGQVTGVVDWEAGAVAGCALRDAARFVLSYSLYLDRHTGADKAVSGHRGLRRDAFGAGIRHALVGDGWYPRLTRRFLADGLARHDLPRSLWYAVALAGLGEVAASANDDQFGEDHLRLLAELPLRPRRARGRR